MSSQLGRLMVDMLVESEQWVQDIMGFFSIFIKLKDSTTSKAFKVKYVCIHTLQYFYIFVSFRTCELYICACL